MFSMVRKLASTVSDYTLGTAIVLAHLALAGRREDYAGFRQLTPWRA
jgi:hypothetical protein